MKTKTKDVYYCEFCGKHGLSKHSMIHHEKICFKNPANDRPCKDCIHLEKKKHTIIDYYKLKNKYHLFELYEGTKDREVNLLFCSKLNKFLYTPKNEIKGNVFDLGSQLNEPMPLDCDSFDTLMKY